MAEVREKMKRYFYNINGVEVDRQRSLCRMGIHGIYGGYKKDILTENLTDRDALLICENCKGIVREAYLSSSGKQFCSCCGLRELSDGGNNRFQQTPNIPVRKMVDSLKCHCPLSERGCEWLGTLKDCEDHLETCGYVWDECKLGCEEVLQRHKLKVHEMENCGKREVSCQHCNRKLKSRELPRHFSRCPNIPMDF